MKLGTIRIGGDAVLIARLSDTEAVQLSDAYAAAGLGPAPSSMRELVRGGRAELDKAGRAVDAALGAQVTRIALDGADWEPPITDPSKVIGVAMNNKGIRKEAHKEPSVPSYFLKPPSCLLGHNKKVVVLENYGETIPELELAAVIGRRGKNIPVAEALDYVFGYSIVNDITSHGIKFGMDSLATTRAPHLTRPHHFEWRNRHGPDDNDIYFVYHTRSKGSDTFGPMGPWITTADEVADPNALEVSGTFDGEPFAIDSTSNFRFRVQEVIADASEWFTLEPGDVICFGTTAKGVGKYPDGHRGINMHRMKGEIGISIQGLGTLTHGIAHSWDEA
jgi:2-keto-4-pentenoate hydratase/2-oxohepta-3-ene-1,7-dioic acid hydratase in catechol pathway